MRFSRQIRKGVLSGLVLLLLVGLFSATQPAVTMAASLKITGFYTISRASHDKWTANHTVLPAPLTVFPAGTTNVGYFLSYSGATPNVSKFQAMIYDGSGKLFITGSVHKLSYKHGHYTAYFYRNNNRQFPDGKYKIKVAVNGKADGGTSFSVGS